MPHDVPESAYAGTHGVSDWFPGRVSRQYRDNWNAIFHGEADDDKKVKLALKHFKQDGCASGCDCSNRREKNA